MDSLNPPAPVRSGAAVTATKSEAKQTSASTGVVEAAAAVPAAGATGKSKLNNGTSSTTAITQANAGQGAKTVSDNGDTHPKVPPETGRGPTEEKAVPPPKDAKAVEVDAKVPLSGAAPGTIAQKSDPPAASKIAPTQANGPASSGSGPKRGRKSRATQEVLPAPVPDESEQPLGKRTRTTTQPFQSVMVDQIQQVVAVSAREKHHAATEDKVVLYDKGEYLAVRNDSPDDFFLCKALQNVYRSSKRIRIYWLNNDGQKSTKIYRLDFLDNIERETILTNVQMRKAGACMQLPDDERRRVLNILERAIRVEKGELDPSQLQDPKAASELGLDVSLVKANEPDTKAESAVGATPSKTPPTKKARSSATAEPKTTPSAKTAATPAPEGKSPRSRLPRSSTTSSPPEKPAPKAAAGRGKAASTPAPPPAPSAAAAAGATAAVAGKTSEPKAASPAKAGKADAPSKEAGADAKKRGRKTNRRTQRTHFGGWGGTAPTSESDFDDGFDDELTSYIELSAASAARRAKERDRALEPGIVYWKGDFLAVRNDFCGFYLCKAQSNVYVTSDNIKIQWLNAEPDNPNVYVLDYWDTIQKDTILTKVEMSRKQRGRLALGSDERRRAQDLLNEALRLERQQQGQPGSSEEAENEPSDQAKPDQADGRSKRLASATAAPSGDVSSKTAAVASDPEPMTLEDSAEVKAEHGHKHEGRKRKSKELAGGGKKDRREDAAGGVRLTIKRGKDIASHVTAVVAQHIINPNIPEMTKDPLWDGLEATDSDTLLNLWSTDSQATISPSADSSACLAGAVLRGDHATLRRLISGQGRLTAFPWQSAHVRRTALDHAVLKGDIFAVRSLLPQVADADLEDGTVSFRRETNLLRATKETESKSGHSKEDRKESKREGNAALLKDTEAFPLLRSTAVAHAKQLGLQRGVPVDVLEELVLYESIGSLGEDDAVEALGNGNIELARAIISRLQLPPNCGDRKLPSSSTTSTSISPLVNRLLGLASGGRGQSLAGESNSPGYGGLAESLRLNDLLVAPLGPQAASAFQLLMAGGRTSLVTVCDVLYGPRSEAAEKAVKEALTQRDARGRTATHYAAAARNSASLEWLISRGANVNELDYEGNSPLHVAAVLGRAECLQLLISLRLREGSSHSHLDDTNRKGQSALHAAIEAEQVVSVQRLLAFGADANKPLGSHSDKVTALMLAAQRGHRLEMLRAILDRTDAVDVQDKRGRSALVHAAMNGHSAAACLLLRRGANATAADGSGNTALHYAAAYGHLHVVKLLVELANLSPAQVNDAKMCSLEVAFRKGHIGVVRYMLDLGCFARGLAGGGGLAERLLNACVTLPDLLEPTMVARFELLIRSSSSLVTKPLDKANSNNLLHLLVLMQRRIIAQQISPSERSMAQHRSCLFQVLDLILGLADAEVVKKAVAATNTEGETPISLALSLGCLEIAARLGRSAPSILKAALKNECALRRIAMHCATFDLSADLLVGLEDDDVAELRTLAQTLAAQKGVNLLCVAVESIDAAIEECGGVGQVEADQRVTNACQFLRWLICRLGMEATGLVLHAAVRCRSPQPLQMILESSSTVPSLNANIEHRQQGLTPLQEAVLQGKTRAALLLVAHGARTDLMMPPSVVQQAAVGGVQPALPLLLFCCLPGQVQDRTFQGELIRAIAEQKTRDLTAIHPVTGDCALHYVVQKRHWDPDDLARTVDTLLRCGLAALATNVFKQTPLHLAAASNVNGDCRIEAALVKAGAAIDVLDLERRLPLHYLFLSAAGRKDPIELCRLLVPSKAQRLLDAVDAAEGATALHYAAQAGAALCCRYLLQRGANIELRNKQGNSAPGLAVLRAHAGATLALIEKGHWHSDEVQVLPNTESSPLGTTGAPLMWRYICPKKPIPQRKSLLQIVFEIAKTVQNGNKLGEHGSDAKPPADKDRPNSGKDSKDDKENARCSGGSAMNAASLAASALLDIAGTADTPNPGSLNTLNAGSKSGEDSLEVMWGSLIPGIIIEQLEHKSHPISLAVDAAVRAEDYPRALKLLARVKHDWTLMSQKQTVLHLLAQQPYGEGQLELAQALLDREVIPQATDEHNCTAITYANINWNHRLAEFLIAKMGIQAVAELPPDLSIRTPLSAIFWNLERQPLPPEMAQLALRLIKAGASINVLSRYPIRNLEFPGTICVSESLLHVENLMACRISPLILAVCKKNYATAKFLLREGGADPNFNDGQKRTPLMYAIKLNDISMAKLLLNYDSIDGGAVASQKVKTEDSSGEVNDSKVKKDTSATNNVDAPIVKKEQDAKVEEQTNQKVAKTSPTSTESDADFVMTSNINLAHQDFFGWTVIHHAVAPLPDVTYVCTDMVRLLAKIGASLGMPGDMQNPQKAFPLSLSAGRGVESITVVLHELLGSKTSDPTPKIVFREPPPVTDAGVLDSLPVRDFRKDAKAQRMRSNGLEQSGANGVAGLGGLDNGGRVDPLAPLDPHEWEVMRDSAAPGQLQPAYDVLLTKLDTHPLVYSFCKLQVAASLDGTRFTLIERSGRVGDSGVAQITPMGSSRVDAAREFCRRFRDRTGANFEEAHTLRPTPGKFRPVLLRSVESGDVNKQEFREGGNNLDVDGQTGILDAVTKAPLPSKLAQPLQALLRHIVKGCELAPGVPCCEDGLREAVSLLEEMRQLAAERRQMEATVETGAEHKDSSATNNQQLAELLLRLAERSHQLHALLPPPAVGYRAGGANGARRKGPSSGIGLVRFTRASPEQLEPLWTEEQIDEQIERVQVLLDLFLARQMLRGAVFAVAEVHPLDYVYKAANCRLQLLQVDSTETQTILQYIYNSMVRWRPSAEDSESSPPPSFGLSSAASNRAPFSVTSVYRLSRAEEEAQIVNEGIGSLAFGVRNHWLLWKPIGAGGLLSAMHRGLQAIPLTGAWREWPQHSRGITFYDRFGQGQAFAEQSAGGRRFALLCQVALGECVELPSGGGRGPSGGHSARLPGRWTPDRRAHISWQSWTVPLGETTLTQAPPTSPGQPSTASHLVREVNEYVVYKPQQVCMRYLVEYH